MHHYRKSQTKVLTERNATFRKFIQDMRAEYAEQVTALSLTAQLTQLETCCTTIERNMNQRQFAKGKRYEAISVKEARTEVQKHFDSMVQVMNTALLLNCTDELLALKEKFNGVVLFYKTAISVRIKAKKNVSNSQAVVSEGAEAMM